jgi:hypothetical protein
MNGWFFDIAQSAWEWTAVVCLENRLLIAAFLVALALIYRSAWRFQVQKARQGYLRFQAKRVGLAVFIYGAVSLILTGQHTSWWRSLLLATGAALVSVALVRPPKRTRYIPARVRHAVLQRDLGHEQNYDSRRHAIDHRVPYSKGGENTVDNLRVLGRVENARKRDRMPTRKDFQQQPMRRRKVRGRRFLWFVLEGGISVWALFEVLTHAR